MSRRTRWLLFPFAAAWVAAPAAAQRSEPSTITALEVSEPIHLDGALDESAWQRAVRISNFTQRELNVGAPVSERTEVAVLYDANALYIGFWGWDREPDGIRASKMARDFSWGGDDNFEVVLDTFDDDRNGYLFVTNPNGARADALIADNGATVNRDWDGVWDVRARRTEQGWFAELRIPFSTLRFRSGGNTDWGINFERNIRRKREQVMWQGWSRDYNLEQLSRAGTLAGVRGIGGVTLLEARPFGAGGAEWLHDGGQQTVGKVGLDLSYLPTPGWKANLTVNPDFAQVESDQEQVNLTRFSLFYPEKRPFFLEGQEFFQFDLGPDARPFYSRRIGLAEDRTEVPIYGGARVLGKSGGTTLGAMALRSGASGGQPATDFAVVRWKQDVLAESSVGVLAVGRHEPGRFTSTYGLDLAYATSSLFGEKELQAGLSLVGTRADRAGLAHRLYLDYPNDLVEFSSSWTRVDAAFDPEVGYLRRSGFQRFASELAILPRPAFLPFIQQFELKPYELSVYVDDATGRLQSLYYELVPLSFTLRTGERFELMVQRFADHPEVAFEPFEGASIPVATYWYTRWQMEASTYGGRAWQLAGAVNGGQFYSGDRTEYSAYAVWRADRHVSLEAEYSHNRLTLGAERFRVHEASARVDVAVSPNLFGAVAGQWNSEDEEIILNVRLNWIPMPGSDVYLVVNQLADATPGFYSAQRTTTLSKVVWRIAF